MNTPRLYWKLYIITRFMGCCSGVGVEGPGRRGLYSINSGWAATLVYPSVGTACKDTIIYQVLTCVL